MPRHHSHFLQSQRGCRSAVFAIVLATSGCASLLGPSTPSPEDLFDACNRAWVGGSINNVLLRYGPPTGKVPFQDDITVYQFQASNVVRLHEDVTTNTTGRVGTPTVNVPYTERTTTTQAYDHTFNCMMRVGVRKDGTVHGVDFVGEMGACKVFMP